MFVDETYQVEIGTANLNKTDGSRSWNVRFDLIIPPKEYRKIDPVFHSVIDLLYKNDDSGFRNLQWYIKWPSLHLLFDEERDNITSDTPAKSVIELSEVLLKPKTIVCWKSVMIVSADGEDKEEERTLVMQVRTSIPNTKRNAALLHRFAEGRSWCRIRGTQKDSFEQSGSSKSTITSQKGAKADTATPMVRAALLAVQKALPGETIVNTDDLVTYLESVAKTVTACCSLLKKLIKNIAGADGMETQTKDLVALFMPRKIVLKDVGDVQSEIVSATWPELYDMIMTLSITLKHEKTKE